MYFAWAISKLFQLGTLRTIEYVEKKSKKWRKIWSAKKKNEQTKSKKQKKSHKVPKLKNIYAKTIFSLFFLGTLTFNARLREKHSNFFKIENRFCP